MTKQTEHTPVLLKEVIKNFSPIKGRRFIDCTYGFGGHTNEIIKRGGKVLAIEWDNKLFKMAKKRLGSCPDASCQIVNDNFANIKKISKQYAFIPDGILFDLGISQWHYQKAKRGFSFKDNQSLDMRINSKLENSALHIINHYSYQELYEIFTKLAQEQLAGPIANALVQARDIKTAKELADLVDRVYKKHGEKTKRNTATKVFLALRILVNNEFQNLETGLKQAWDILEENGKLLVISFHSGEDRIVKLFFKSKNTQENLLIFPSSEEIKNNPLARSAKLRVLTK